MMRRNLRRALAGVAGKTGDAAIFAAQCVLCAAVAAGLAAGLGTLVVVERATGGRWP